MAVMQSDGGKMEGWLHLIRSNRFGLQYSRRRYFVLQDHLLKSFKAIPLSSDEKPVKSAIIDSCIRVTDNGRQTTQRKVIFFFTLYNTSNHNDQLKLGANSPEEAAKWIQAFQESALKRQGLGFAACEPPSRRLNCSSKHANSIDWTMYSSSIIEAMTSDVVAPSPWKIFGCRDGLRLFKEANDKEFPSQWDDHPAIMAVGVLDATSESIFQTVMSLGPSRSEWDFCFYKGSVIEHLDGHSDIIHILLYRHWLPW
ncbi:hypothetical protein M569_14116, partial [Genlisea aurea]